MSEFDKALFRLVYIEMTGLFVFGMVVAVFHVQELTSFGLPQILHTIELLTSATIGLLAGRNMPKTDNPPPGA